VQHEYTIFDTKNGFAALAWNENGVSGLRLPASSEARAEASVLRRFPQARRTTPSTQMASLISEIKRYFDGEKVDFSAVPLDLGSQDPFFARVYAEVRKLGWVKRRPMAPWPKFWVRSPRRHAMWVKPWHLTLYR